jgi:hypothetical protein
MSTPAVVSAQGIELARLAVDPKSLSLSGSVHILVIVAVVAVAIILIVIRLLGRNGFRTLEIDQTEIGVGNGKVTFKPNNVDRQVGYAIWVELSTRKIGLDIDLEHDVVSEIYDSWYNFFAVTRELIKTVPITRVNDQSTKKIVELSINVLNEGLRPHLTQWQARFRRWYEYQLGKDVECAESPQDIQKRFPLYSDLEKDMLSVNRRLKAYRESMRKLVYGES